jgi:hypothetical protein
LRAQATPIASRYADPQRWWIASQLVARNPDLRLHLQVDLIDGEALVLTLTESATIPLETRIGLRIVLDEQGVKLVAPALFEPLLWAEVLSFTSPLEAVKRIEASLGLLPFGAQEERLPARPLSYTILALLLAARANDHEGWYVRSLHPELLGVDDWGPTNLKEFPTLTDHLVNMFELDIARQIEPQAHEAWILCRGLDPVAVFDGTGGLHVHGVRFSLPEIYLGTGCDLHQTATSVAALIG